jgi:uncharacterized protein
MNYNNFPFNFKELASKKYLITNNTNSFSILENRKDLENLILNKYEYLDISVIDELESKNFIYDEKEYEIKLNIFVSNLSTKIYSNLNKPSLFLIIPTLRCDLDCSYCQVSRVGKNKKGFDLDKQYIDEIIRVIGISSDKSLKIEFQGGEPLLNFDFIKIFVQKIKNQIIDKKIFFVICTTLNNITEEILYFCKENNIFLSTSLDGNKEIHNANRPSKYYDSYERFISKLKSSRDILGKNNISALSTVTKETLKDYKKFINGYLDNKFTNISIRPLTSLGYAFNDNKLYSAEEYFTFYKDCLEYIFEINKNQLLIEENLLIFLSKIFTPFSNNYLDLQSPSSYMMGALVFNYDGKIFGSDESRMLWQMTKLKELELGDITTKNYNFLNENNVSILSNSFIETMPRCEDCTYKEYCGVDIFHHLSTQSDIIGDKSISFFCKLNTMIFDYIFDSLINRKDIMEVYLKWTNH